MDLKHEMLYRDDVLLVKSEPRLHSPCPTALPAVSNALPSNNGLAATLAGGSANGQFAGAANGQFAGSPPGGKRPRTDDWLSSPSPGTVSVSGPPLTPSPGPQSYTVISNGYSSPMSSGSYDPYSPNGKIGEYLFV